MIEGVGVGSPGSVVGIVGLVEVWRCGAAVVGRWMSFAASEVYHNGRGIKISALEGLVVESSAGMGGVGVGITGDVCIIVGIVGVQWYKAAAVEG